MFVYHYRLFDRYNRAVVSLAVLADDKPGWRPERFGYELWNCGVAFWFASVKLLDWAKDEAALEASDNPIAAVVLAHLKAQATATDAEARRYWKFRLVKGLYLRGWSADDVRELFRLVDWLMELPPDLEKQLRRDLSAIEEDSRMPYVTSWERMGAERGRAEGLREAIEVTLRHKFPRAGRQLLPEIRLLSDPKKLRALQRAIVKATSIDDVRRLLE